MVFVASSVGSESCLPVDWFWFWSFLPWEWDLIDERTGFSIWDLIDILSFLSRREGFVERHSIQGSILFLKTLIHGHHHLQSKVAKFGLFFCMFEEDANWVCSFCMFIIVIHSGPTWISKILVCYFFMNLFWVTIYRFTWSWVDILWFYIMYIYRRYVCIILNVGNFTFISVQSLYRFMLPSFGFNFC